MKIWIVILSTLGLAFGISGAAFANSFVGNGGGQGDVELSVTLMQIHETFAAIEKHSEDKPNLCTCNRMYQGRPICEPLAALSDPQVQACNRSLYKAAPVILKLVTDRANIHFTWTDVQIEVHEGGRLRAVDAVANREKREITVNQRRFLAMQPAERVFLLTHELLHFTDSGGKPLSDEGSIGPFLGNDGGRDFINAMAAAAGVMQGAYPQEIKSYRAKLHRSQAQKMFWFALDVGGGSPQNEYSDKFQFNSYQRVQLKTRVEWTHWGLELALRGEWAEGSVLDTIKTEEQIYTIGFGPTYRFFMASDPLTFWGQSHILIHTLAEIGRANYKYHEDASSGPTLSAEDQATFLGANIGASYYMPLFFGFWGYVGVQYEFHPYKYEKSDVNLNFNHNLISGNIGVSYAF